MPVNPKEPWKSEWYRFGQGLRSYYLVDYILLACELPSAVMVATVIMGAMGQLAVELSESVKTLLKGKRNCFFCAQCSYRCKRYGVFGLCAVFLVVALGVWVEGLYKIS